VPDARAVILAELRRIARRVPAGLGAPRGRFLARELDAALRRAGPCAPGSACRTLRAMRAEGLGVECVDSAAGVYRLTADEIERLTESRRPAEREPDGPSSGPTLRA
jgi:hypothetical protein